MSKQYQTFKVYKPYKIIPILMGLVMVQASATQWQWRDANGQQVFSDSPPPASVPDAQIIKRPPIGFKPKPMYSPTTTDKATPPPPPTPSASSPNATGTPNKPKPDANNNLGSDPNLKRKAEAEAQRQATERQENCERAKQNLATIESGMRISTVNERGERSLMTDTQRAAEKQRAQASIRNDCGNALPQ